MPKAMRRIPAAAKASSVLGTTGVGKLSTQKYPRSSSAATAVDLPAPLSPVTTTTEVGAAPLTACAPYRRVPTPAAAPSSRSARTYETDYWVGAASAVPEARA